MNEARKCAIRVGLCLDTYLSVPHLLLFTQGRSIHRMGPGAYHGAHNCTFNVFFVLFFFVSFMVNTRLMNRSGGIMIIVAHRILEGLSSSILLSVSLHIFRDSPNIEAFRRVCLCQSDTLYSQSCARNIVLLYIDTSCC